MMNRGLHRERDSSPPPVKLMDPRFILDNPLCTIRLPRPSAWDHETHAFLLNSLGIQPEELRNSFFHALSNETWSRNIETFPNLIRILLCVGAINLDLAKERWPYFPSEVISSLDEKISSLSGQRADNRVQKTELLLRRLEVIASLQPEIHWELSNDMFTQGFKRYGLRQDSHVCHKILALAALYHPSELPWNTSSDRDHVNYQYLTPADFLWKQLNSFAASEATPLLYQRFFELSKRINVAELSFVNIVSFKELSILTSPLTELNLDIRRYIQKSASKVQIASDRISGGLSVKNRVAIVAGAMGLSTYMTMFACAALKFSEILPNLPVLQTSLCIGMLFGSVIGLIHFADYTSDLIKPKRPAPTPEQKHFSSIHRLLTLREEN